MRVERLAKQKRLNGHVDSGDPVVVDDPESIAEYQQRPRDAEREGTEDPVRSVALTRVVEPNLVPARFGAPNGLEAAFLSFIQSKLPGSPVPIERRLFLTIAEAAEFGGLPMAFLRQLIASGKLKALKTGAGWRISRVALEGLSGTLTDAAEGLDEHQQRDMEVNRRRRQGLALKSDSLQEIS
jgi:excisionase family DNA binding protein